MKATALFGGVRVFQIIIHIIRAKVVAMLIGPAGMGIHNLLKSTLDTVNHVTGCGLQTSAVRDIAKAHDGGDQERIDVVITSLRLIVWLTGLIGVLVVFFGSAPLSYFAFGNYEYSTAFKYLSIIMFATQLNTGQVALLQGTFHYKYLAKSSLIGNFLSLLLTIPLYYYLREKGIVPALIIASLITLYYSWNASRKVTFHYVKLPFSKLFLEGKGMLTLGLVLAIGSLIGNLSSYLMNIFISHSGSISDVGLYTAGTTIANSYIFLVMSSMSTDYVPRLSALNGNIEAQNEVVGFYIAGLDGIGVAFIVDYIFELLLIFIVCHRKYQFRLSPDCQIVIFYSVVICTITLVSVYVLSSYWRYVIGIVLLLLACVYSIKELNKRVNLKAIISKFRK